MVPKKSSVSKKGKKTKPKVQKPLEPLDKIDQEVETLELGEQMSKSDEKEMEPQKIEKEEVPKKESMDVCEHNKSNLAVSIVILVVGTIIISSLVSLQNPMVWIYLFIFWIAVLVATYFKSKQSCQTCN